MIKTCRLFFVLVFPLICLSQEENLVTSHTIPSALLENANAVVRLDDIHIEVESYNKMVYTNKRIVTILNSSGNSKVGTSMGYDENVSIKKMEAKIYNSSGEEIKKFKKNDFEDVSAVDGGTLYSDSRVKYMRYTPTDYPYTVVFETEVEYGYTAYIPRWKPIEGYYISTETSRYSIKYDPSNELNIYKNYFKEFNVLNNSKDGEIYYEAYNLKAIMHEAYSPNLTDVTPYAMINLKNFSYEGYIGNTNDWHSLGQWMHEQLLVGRTEVSEKTKSEIRSLVANMVDPIDKAKAVYQYVQNNTRYISVQEGIGGIQPIDALKVDEVKYGDCKGLSNYTKALLDLVGVESYYTRVYASPDNLVSIKNDFVSFLGQTNHVILNLPYKGENIWLECTSQTSPFGYSANFTDDRDVFVITPEGGKIVRTKVYSALENLLDTKANIIVTENGDMEAKISLNSYGTQYGHHVGIQNSTLKDQTLHYKNYWNYINNVDVGSMTYNNDKDSIVFTENIELTAKKYASQTGDRLLLSPNFFNVLSNVPTRYRDRTLPFEIERGFYDKDDYEISIPENFEVEALQEDTHIKNQFGEYAYSIVKKSEIILSFKRTFILNKGAYAKEDYEAFRNFWLEVVKQDKSRIILIKKS
ncbi:transglutaminase-like putative cysteine protease [Gelidibacter algens]|uniref:Transglutaminase-like putative cysteine protease n=2 Tax=Gelidibacter algens TaxID=49280 RepID=A0A327S0L1_9FLAO|nr:DUF3857 domain-containing protein [Gelidibacter algens]RAJ22519.1 transglutaminase-like putative cysteine protease [Gelidibacter algens]